MTFPRRNENDGFDRAYTELTAAAYQQLLRTYRAAVRRPKCSRLDFYTGYRAALINAHAWSHFRVPPLEANSDRSGKAVQSASTDTPIGAWSDGSTEPDRVCSENESVVDDIDTDQLHQVIQQHLDSIDALENGFTVVPGTLAWTEQDLFPAQMDPKRDTAFPFDEELKSEDQQSMSRTCDHGSDSDGRPSEDLDSWSDDELADLARIVRGNFGPCICHSLEFTEDGRFEPSGPCLGHEWLREPGRAVRMFWVKRTASRWISAEFGL
jgi:hypothetical protein